MTLSPEVAEFARSKFSSLEQIQVFVFMYDNRARPWTPAEVATALSAPPESVGMRLFLLASSSLVQADGSADVTYRYVPSPPLDMVASTLSRIQRDHPAMLDDIINPSPAPDPARQLADAFRVRK